MYRTEPVCGASVSFHLSSGKILYAQFDTNNKIVLRCASTCEVTRDRQIYSMTMRSTKSSRNHLNYHSSFALEELHFSPVSPSILRLSTLWGTLEAAGQSQSSSGFSRAEHDQAGPPCCPRRNGLSSCLSAGSILKTRGARNTHTNALCSAAVARDRSM
jgi:hypothetical protein